MHATYWEWGDHSINHSPVLLYCHSQSMPRIVSGDFTKYGRPVPRPDPPWRFGIAHFQFWGWRYPQTEPFFFSIAYAKLIWKLVGILSQLQCVKHGIDLYRYHYSHISNKWIYESLYRVIVRTKHQKRLHFVTHVIITIMQTHYIHGNMCSRPIYWLDCVKRYFSMKYDILRNDYKNGNYLLRYCLI